MDVIFWNGGIIGTSLARSIGPYKIAHWIRKHGYDAQVIDFVDKIDEETLYQTTKKFITSTTKILALSTTFISSTQYTHSNGKISRYPEHLLNVLKRIKKDFTFIKVVLGGYASERLSSHNVIDATIMSYTSPSEDIFLEYLDHLTKGTPAPYVNLMTPSWGKVPRNMFDRARTPRYNIEEDDFRWSTRDLIFPGEPLPLDISRGCIFACKFCRYPHLGKKKFDYIRGMKYIEEELLYNYEKFGTTSYYILDDTFNDSEFKVQSFYEMTQRLPFKIKFSAYIRADLIHRFPNMAPLLQDAGLVGAFHGLETFHPSASKLIGKGWSGTHAKEWIPKLFHDIWKRKVSMQTTFIIGLPKDTKENVLDTVKWYQENNMHSIKFYPLGLYGPNKNRGYTTDSEFDRNAENYGFKFTNVKGSDPTWENDNWNLESAKQLAEEVNSMVAPVKKISSWRTPTLLWYGLSEQYILNTPQIDIPWSFIQERTTSFYREYFYKLKSL